MNKLTVVLCEGDHDISFLFRILSSNGYKEATQKICELPEPFCEDFKTKLENSDSKWGFYTNVLIPNLVMKKDMDYIFFHNMRGVDSTKQRSQVLSEYKELIPEGSESRFVKSYFDRYKFLYFVDADDIGSEKRRTEISAEIGLELKIDDLIKDDDEIEYGIYVFRNYENDKGSLEEILLNILEKNEKKLYDKVDKFMKNESDQLEIEGQRQKQYNNELKCYRGQSYFNYEKSKISILGQLQFSGLSNSVIIKNSDFFKNENLERLPEYEKILSLFE
ncbi:MAG: hypothetical protein MJH09_07325 [Cetobacterium sp.]|nr:hypothetical protein [Cetobacterium sp.]